MTGAANPWQPVVAALANSRMMTVYAARVLGVEHPATEKELRRLVQMGLLAAGTFDPVPGALADILAANTEPTPEGVDKFFDGGRRTHLPMNPALRNEVLGHLAAGSSRRTPCCPSATSTCCWAPSRRTFPRCDAHSWTMGWCSATPTDRRTAGASCATQSHVSPPAGV